MQRVAILYIFYANIVNKVLIIIIIIKDGRAIRYEDISDSFESDVV